MNNNNSTKYPYWAVALEPIRGLTARIILTGILAFMFQGEGAVGCAEMSQWTGKSKRTIWRYLRKLEDLGFLTTGEQI